MNGRRDYGSSLLDRLWEGVVSLLALAVGVRLAASWLAGLLPLLIVLVGVVSVLWLACRYRPGRRPWNGAPWP